MYEDWQFSVTAGWGGGGGGTFAAGDLSNL